MRLRALGIGIAALLWAGCDDDDTVEPRVDAGVEVARLRVVHAAPDAPEVDIYAEGDQTPLLTSLAYGETSDFLSLPIGTYTLQIRAAGSPAEDAPVHTVQPLSLRAGEEITAVAAGLLGSTLEADRFRVLALSHDFGEAGADRVRARVVHLGVDAPTVEVDVGDDGTPELTSLERFSDTGPQGVDLPADQALQLAIRAGGDRVTAFTTPALPAGAELFIIATGRLEAKPRETDGFALLAVGPEGTVGLIRQNPFIYALHASPDAPAVDVFVGQNQLVDQLSFGQLSGTLQVPPGTYELELFAHQPGAERPDGDPAVTARTPGLNPGERYLVLATGLLAAASGAEPFRLVALAEGFAAAGDQARLRVVHASPDAPAVDVGVVTAGELSPLPGLTNLAFGESTAAEGLEVEPGLVTLGVAPTGSTTPVAAFDVSPTAGLEAFVIAAGALAPEGGQPGFRLMLVDTTTSPWQTSAVQPD